MNKKTYVYVGNWSFNSANPKGISCFEYNDETGTLLLKETILPELAAGQLCLNAEKGVLYSNDERGELPGKIGGGGSVSAFKIDDETGALEQIGFKPSLCPEPSYLCLDKSGKYLIVCHCADPFHVTHIERTSDDKFTNRVLFDDTALVLFHILDDGNIGEIADVKIIPGKGSDAEASQIKVDPMSGHIQMVRVLSRLHSVVASPDGEMIVVCDKGMDRIYTYKIDRELGKLVHLFTWEAPEWACFPRYSCFHPEKSVLYVNNENLAQINCFHYNTATGELERFHKTFLLKEDPGLIRGKPVGCQDILVHPNGKALYVTLSVLHMVVTCRLDENGVPEPVQWFPCYGKFPRGIALSPDGRFLLCGNMISGNLVTFAVEEDGMLVDTDESCKAVSPSAIRFYVPADTGE